MIVMPKDRELTRASAALCAKLVVADDQYEIAAIKAALRVLLPAEIRRRIKGKYMLKARLAGSGSGSGPSRAAAMP
jgi:hypothetical protein